MNNESEILALIHNLLQFRKKLAYHKHSCRSLFKSIAGKKTTFSLDDLEAWAGFSIQKQQITNLSDFQPIQEIGYLNFYNLYFAQTQIIQNDQIAQKILKQHLKTDVQISRVLKSEHFDKQVVRKSLRRRPILNSKQQVMQLQFKCVKDKLLKEFQMQALKIKNKVLYDMNQLCNNPNKNRMAKCQSCKAYQKAPTYVPTRNKLGSRRYDRLRLDRMRSPTRIYAPRMYNFKRINGRGRSPLERL